MNKNLIILPKPQEIQFLEGNYRLRQLNASDYCNIQYFSSVSDICFAKINGMKDEEYKLEITESGIRICYSQQVGAYRAASTLKQILLQTENQTIPCLHIHDFPNIVNRGLMLDISRGKIPKLATLKELVDLLSDLKYNQLQLYMESFVFEYKNFPQYCKDTQPLTVSEIAELEQYCAEHFIELVPNQNGFGHMGAWLEKEELKGLGIHNDEGRMDTLNPLEPKSLELMDQIYNSLLPNFGSKQVNIGLDEPVSLGKGQTKEACEAEGVGKIYVDYLIKICELVKEKYHKTPMFWADIIFKHPEQLERIPKDCVVMEWGYETEHKYDRNCRRLQELELDFYVCPGTSSWGSLTGRSNNMLFNIHTATEIACYYGAKGFLLTDWGDDGHFQFQSISYFAYALGGAYAWNCGSHDTETAHTERMHLIKLSEQYLDLFVFHMKSEDSLANLLYRMGNYYLTEDYLCFNGTRTSTLLRAGLKDLNQVKNINRDAVRRVITYMNRISDELNTFPSDHIIIREIKLNCHMVIVFAKAILVLHQKANNVKSKEIQEILNELDNMKEEYQILWNQKNHKIGADIFLAFVETIASAISYD